MLKQLEQQLQELSSKFDESTRQINELNTQKSKQQRGLFLVLFFIQSLIFSLFLTYFKC